MTDTVEEVREYKIEAARFSTVEAKIAKLAKKAAKLGVPAPTMTVVRDESVPLMWKVYHGRTMEQQPEGLWVRCAEEDAERHERIIVVTVEGEAPHLPGGWKFAGTVQHTEVGNVVRVVPDLQVWDAVKQETVTLDGTLFREGSPTCAHCKTKRNRRDTYLVVDDIGTIAQVGSDCIKDFLGGQTPEQIVSWTASLMDFFSDLDDWDDGGPGGYGMRNRETIYLTDYLAEVVAAIDAHGWLSKGKAVAYQTPTADRAEYNLFAECPKFPACWKHQASHRDCDVPTDEQKAEADEVLTFVRESLENPTKPLDDYEWNLRVVTAREWIESRETGLAASAVSYFRRQKNQEIKRAERRKADAASEYVGELKERSTRRLQLVFSTGWETDYGYTELFKFKDGDGNVFVWFSTGAGLPSGWAIDDWFDVKGTIKSHEERDGVKQTILSRCAVSAIKEETEDVKS